MITKRSKRARLARTAHGMVPASDGWFIMNAKDSVWYSNGFFGSATRFEDTKKWWFPQMGLNIRVLGPGQPNCHYHAESMQEDFLVLSGRCRVLIDGKNLKLKPWDLVHCPPWTDHVFVGAGKEPCVILMVGTRSKDEKIRYLRTPLAVRYKASTPKSTSEPRVSYSLVPRSTPVPAPPPFGRKANRGIRGRRP